MIRTLLDDDLPGSPQFTGLHAAGGYVWVWGYQEPQGTDGPSGLVARRWNGAAWQAADRARVHNGFHVASSLASGFGDGAGSAWTSPNANDAVISNVAYSTGGAWVDQLAEGQCFLAGLGPTDLYALVALPLVGPSTQLNYYHHTGGGWGSRQLAALAPRAYNSFVIGNGIAPSAPDPAGVRAAVCPDGAIVLTGGGSENALGFPREAFVWVLSGGTVFEGVTIDQEPTGAHYTFRGIWAGSNSDIYLVIEETGVGRGLYHWDRSTRDTVTLLGSPTWGYGTAIHGVSPTDWWTINGDANALQVAHWNGSAYLNYSLPDPLAGADTTLTAVYAAGPSDVWVVGKCHDPITGQYAAPVWHWNGSAWAVHHLFTS